MCMLAAFGRLFLLQSNMLYSKIYINIELMKCFLLSGITRVIIYNKVNAVLSFNFLKLLKVQSMIGFIA